MERIEEQVKDLLSKLTGETEITSEKNLQTDLYMDSLSLVTMLVEIEDRFKIELGESDMNPLNLLTVSNVVDLVSKYVEGNDEKES